MIRIIHLTDFHLNEQNLKEWNSIVRKAMISKLEKLHEENAINLIAYTGDLIEKGGKDFRSAQKAFEIFKDEVIFPITSVLRLSINQFMIIPGNHDIERNKDNEITEIGLKGFFNKDINNVTKYITASIKQNNYAGGIERIKSYKEFERSLYNESDTNNKLSIFGSSFRHLMNEESVGVCCLNSAWRSYDNEDAGNLIIGEEQLQNSYDFISNCDIKIAMIHHPLDWLFNKEKNQITKQINKDFDLLLLGQSFINRTSMHTGFTDNLFTNIIISDQNDLKSGKNALYDRFSLIDYDRSKREITSWNYRYDSGLNDFNYNIDIENNEEIVYKFPEKKTIDKQNLIETILSNIKNEHFSELDDHFIGQKADITNSSIKESFVIPPIDNGESNQEEETCINITEIAKDKSNKIFFGNQESGKTSLLYRLVREFTDEYVYIEKIPVYIDFEEQKNKEIETCIKEYLRCSSEDVKYLLEQKQIVILIDNLNYRKGDKTDQINKLHRFISKNEEITIIATAVIEIAGVLPTDYIELCKIAFKNYFIRYLKAKEIKSIMKIWLPKENEINAEERLEKLVTNFQSYSLPSTAMSVSLFIWSMENKERKPINHAVLLEIYIELLLEKLSRENIYRDKFDFTNKIQLIARIAEIMLKTDETNYSITYDNYKKEIKNYLKNLVGFDFDSEVIAQYFLDRKIFVKYNSKRIKFAYSFYFHFFIAKRMEYMENFKEYIMGEERYYKFYREIDYYTALRRSDKSVLEKIYERFNAGFTEAEFILGKIDIDKYFTPQIKGKPQIINAKDIDNNKIKKNRPTEEMIEEFHNQRLESIKDPSTIVKKDGSISMDFLMTIMSNVLRNSEGVEDRELKKEIYYSLIKNSIVYMIFYKESLIHYVINNKQLPPSIPSNINLYNLIKNFPYYVQNGMYNHLGTTKLVPIILEKINDDKKGRSKTKSDIESFLSVALYSDIQGNDFPKELKNFVKKLKNNVVRDYAYYKLVEYYYRRTRPGSPNEEMYLGILSELKLRAMGWSGRLREDVVRSIKEGKRKFLGGKS